MQFNNVKPTSKLEEEQLPVHEAKEDSAHKRTNFVNDLTPEDIERAVSEYAKRIREQLSSETITPNCMSRLLNMAHPRVMAILKISNSAREAILGTDTNRLVRAKSLLQKLTPEQRQEIIEQIASESSNEDCSDGGL